MNGEISPNPVVNTIPSIFSDVATERALRLVSKLYEAESSKLRSSEPELWIYNPILLGLDMNMNILVWRIEVRSTDYSPINELVLIDAQRGFVALHFNQINYAKYRLIYDNQNNPSYGLPGYGPVRIEGQGSTGIPDVDLAYTYAGDTYDFYYNYHGRDSINNAGMSLINTVRFCNNTDPCPFPNAFWNGTQMVYGQGYSSADDVVAHEMTHGVTDYESNLFYYMQSGAINESFSDLWGEFVDLTNGHGNDSPSVRWLIGEDLSGGAGRDMENPPAYSDPDRMTSMFYFCETSDRGGVHINSGVNNKAVYLMVDGGTFNSKTVTGIGIEKTAKIYYEAQTNLLTSGSDYSDLYDLLQLACNNLIGVSGITSADCTQVKNAIDAVEMNLEPLMCPTPCPSGTTPVDLFFDDFESGGGDWSANTIVGSNAWALLLIDNYLLFGQDLPFTSESYAQMIPSFSIPPNAYMHFIHYYDFEYDGGGNYDGGLVAYSNNGGSNWYSAGSLFINNGYNGVISNAYGNPLGGASAFVRESNGFISSRLNLNSLTGQNIKFSFWIGTDSTNIYSPLGWVIDDVRIYTCQSTTVAVTITTSPSGRQITVDGTPYTAPQTFNWTPGTSHTIGVSSPQSGAAGTQYVYSSWSDGGGQSHSITTPASPTTYTAYFTTQYQLTTAVNPPGSGSVNPNCPSGCWYNSGSQFDLTATPAGGYAFSSWSGSVSSTANPLNITMNALKSVTANFVTVVPGTLQVTPVDGFASIGEQGGPFSPSTKQYTLSNIGNSSINWTASKGQPFIDLSSSGGTLTAGANTIVTVSVNSLATSLPIGTYQDTVTFTNTTNGNGNTTRPVLLQIDIDCDDIVLDGGFEAGTPNPSWTEASTHYGTPLCTLASCGNGGGTAGPRTGSWWAWFGGVGELEQGSVSQSVTIPANNTATLRFHLWNGISSGNGTDNFKVLMESSELFVITEGTDPYTSGYTEVTLDLTSYADGNPHTLSFQSTVNGPVTTNFSLDDVSLTICPSTMGSISGVVTDGSSGIQGVSVKVFDTLSNFVSRASTDVNGHYTVANVPAGDYKVQFKACAWGYVNEWYDNQTDFTSADAVNVIESSTTSGINASLAESSETFTDIQSGFWAESYIKALACEGITGGYSDGTYRPSQNVQRSQMAAFIIRAKFGEDFSYSATPHFTDVLEGHWAFKYVQKMYDEGITTGYSDGTYRPSQNVQRSQMASFIIKALFGDVFVYTTTPYFSDIPNTHWAFRYIQKMYDEGITTGYTDGTYRPSQNVSRAQMATFIGRAFLGME
jgi:bacillolysin